MNLVITSGGTFLYAPLIQGGIAAFAINASTGALSNVVGPPFATANPPYSLAIGGGGQFLYSIGGILNPEIEGFSISAGSGALTTLAGSPFPAPSAMSSLVVDSSGKYLYATVQASTLAESQVFGFAIDSSSGNLSMVANSPFAAAPFPVNAVSLDIP